MDKETLDLVLGCWESIWTGSAYAYYQWIEKRYPGRYHCEDAVLHEMMTVTLNMARSRDVAGLKRYYDYLLKCARNLDACLDKWHG